MSIMVKPTPYNGRSARILRAADANIIGGTLSAAARDRVRVSLPAGGPMTNAASAPRVVWWDLGFDVSYLADRHVGLRIQDVGLPVGTSADVVLGSGLVYTNGTPNLSTDTYGWLQLTFGLGAAANTTCNTITRRSTNSIVPGDTVLDFVQGDYVARHPGVGNAFDVFTGWVNGASASEYNGSSDPTAVSRSLGVKAFVLVGRSANEASGIDVEFGAVLLTPGSA